MVTIYALINPFNNEPFYVGSTNQVLSSRLKQHIQLTEGIAKKKDLINEINSAGLKVEILSLLICPNNVAGKCERHIYELLLSNGYTLYQIKGRVIRHRYH